MKKMTLHRAKEAESLKQKEKLKTESQDCQRKLKESKMRICFYNKFYINICFRKNRILSVPNICGLL